MSRNGDVSPGPRVLLCFIPHFLSTLHFILFLLFSTHFLFLNLSPSIPTPVRYAITRGDSCLGASGQRKRATKQMLNARGDSRGKKKVSEPRIGSLEAEGYLGDMGEYLIRIDYLVGSS